MNRNSEDIIREAVGFYCRNPTWKSRYEGASDNVKRYFEYSFAHGYATFNGKEEEYKAVKKDIDDRLISLYKTFSDKEWEEAIQVCGARQGLMMAREFYQERK